MADAPVQETKSSSADILGTGRRKTSVARVRLRPGHGNIVVNERPLNEFFANERYQKAVLAPLLVVGRQGEFDVTVRVSGGGVAGQSQACTLGIARALKRFDPQTESALRDAGHLTRDSRMKERKKYGFRGARRGTQFSKR